LTRDFWGRRWNSVIHESLKSGVVLPDKNSPPDGYIRRCNFRHDWIHSRLRVGAGPLPSLDVEGSSNWGLFRLLRCNTLQTNTLLLWNGGDVLLGKQVGHLPPFPWIAKHLALRTCIIDSGPPDSTAGIPLVH
jgi:hypothetical protein